MRPLLPPVGKSTLTLRGVRWPEISSGDDLAALLVQTASLRAGDIAVVTSKVVSKAEGRTRHDDRANVVVDETVRVLARRADSVIAETRHGLVLAAAGVDASNTPVGTVVLLPLDPDASARSLREEVYRTTGHNVAVIITDTLGRAWRNGQIDLAIGCAGLHGLVELRGAHDSHGNELTVTAPAVADEVAAAADLVKGKFSEQPVAVLSVLGELELPPGSHGGGAAELIRDSALDLFGLGAREAAVAAAMRDDQVALAHFPPLIASDDLPWGRLTSHHAHIAVSVQQQHAAGAANVRSWLLTVEVAQGAGSGAYVHAGALVERARVLAAAYRLVVDDVDPAPPRPSWRTIAVLRCLAP